ncbi:pyruvate kinase, partial [Micrococcus endophyticus]
MGIDLTTELTALRDRLLSAEAEHADLISRVRDRHRASARNLVHYVALRGTDLRPLQDALSDVGLSSLGRMEAGVLGHVDA